MPYVRLVRVVALSAAILAGSSGAEAATRLTTECQKNLDDGRVLITDGRATPDNVRYRLISFQASRREGGWAYGRCVYELTPR